jgi:peptide/nickel transport system substrate-binding protein
MSQPPSSSAHFSRRALLGGTAAAAAGILWVRATDAAGNPVSTSRLLTSNPQEAVSGGTLTIGLGSEPDNLDMQVSPYAVSANVGVNLFDSLVYQDPADASYKPGLAESWEVTPDGLSYTFKLRSGVTFHDGTPYDAEAQKFNFDRTADPATKSGFAGSLLGPYTGSEVIDPQTIKVNFSEPFAPFLDSLSQAFLAPQSPKAIQELGAEFGTKPVGTGPFKFKEWVSKDHLTLERNPDYNWASAVYLHQGPAYLDAIIFKFVLEGATRTGTLQSGETQLIESIEPSDIELIESDGLTVLQGPIPGYPNAALIDATVAPTDDLAVRQAIVAATDQAELATTIFFDAYPPASAALSASSWAYNAAVAAQSAFDLDKANAALDAAGWALNGDYREKDGAKLSVKFTYAEPWDGGDYAELWQAQLKKAGIELVLSQLDPASKIEAIHGGQSNLAVTAWTSSDPIVLEHLFHSKNIEAGYAFSRYNDPALDEALDSGRAEVDFEKRKAFYGTVQQIIADQSLISPFYDQVAINGVATQVHDVRLDSRSTYRWLYDTWIEQ